MNRKLLRRSLPYKTLRTTSCIVLGTMLVFAGIGPAYAYVDPGTASIFLQAVIGAIAVAGIYFRGWISKILGLFSRGRKNKEDLPQPNLAEVKEHNADDR